MTQLSGGKARNIVPSELSATFDIRIAPPTDINQFERQLESWLNEAQGDDGDSGKITWRIESVFKILQR